jgi:hypothetical protein
MRLESLSEGVQSPGMGAQPEFVLHHRSDHMAIASVDGFILMRCFGDVSPSDIAATLKAYEVALASRPAGVGSLVAIDSTTAFPSEELRGIMVDAARKTSQGVQAHSIIILGDGFWASAFRGVATTVAALARSTYPRRVFRHEQAGVDWAIGELGESKKTYRDVLLDGLTQLKGGAETSMVHPGT